jgi:phosphonate transport system substrate-binding protein
MRKRPLSCPRPVWLLAATLVSVAPGMAAENPAELRIGLIPEMNVFEQVDRFRLLADFLSERIVKKEVDAAFLGSFTGALASVQLGMEPVARPINLDGSSTYWGYIFVRKDSGIETVEQMSGKRLALVERATTAGYVFPVAYFRRHGIEDVDRHFSEIQFWGSHDATINAVLDARADVGAAKNTIWEHLSQEDPRVSKELLILATSPKVPSNGLFLSPEVDPTTRDKIRSTLLNLHDDSAANQILPRLRAKGFVPTDTESYRPVFTLASEAGIDLASYTYQNQ